MGLGWERLLPQMAILATLAATEQAWSYLLLLGELLSSLLFFSSSPLQIIPGQHTPRASKRVCT